MPKRKICDISPYSGGLFSGGKRNVAASIDVVRTLVFNASNGDRADSRNVAIVFLHGASADEAETTTAASAARAAGITLLAVGVTGNVRARELDSIASYPMRSTVFRIPNYYSFVNILGGLTRAACNGRYLQNSTLLGTNRHDTTCVVSCRDAT